MTAGRAAASNAKLLGTCSHMTGSFAGATPIRGSRGSFDQSEEGDVGRPHLEQLKYKFVAREHAREHDG